MDNNYGNGQNGQGYNVNPNMTNNQQYNYGQQNGQQQNYQQQNYQQQSYRQQNYQQQNYQQQYNGQQMPNQQMYNQQPVYQTGGGNGNNGGNNQNNGGKKTGLIVGLIIAVVAIIAIIIVVVLMKNKKDDDSDSKGKSDKTETVTEADLTEATERDTEATEEATNEVSEDTTEDVAKDVNHDPNNGEDYVPENPIIVDNEVFTVEITNIHHFHPEAEEYDYEERSYRWDMKITNNRKKGGIEVNAMDCEYNGIIIGRKELNPDDAIAPGESREVSFMWLDESDWLSDYSGFTDATSIKVYFTAIDEEFQFLIGEDVEYYPYGEENAVSDLPDLSGLTPLIDYNGLKFYLTCFYTKEEGFYESMPLKGFIINDSDVNYYLEDQWEDMTLNGVSTGGNYLTTYAGAHKVYYFQAWVDGTEEPVMASDSNTIQIRYKLIECTRQDAGTYAWEDEVYDSIFECTLPSYKY